MADTNSDLEDFLAEQEENIHYNFIHRNICLFIENRKLELSLIFKKIGKAGGVYSLVNNKGKEVHRFILTASELFTKRNEWIENEFPITILPSSISSRDDLLGIKFHITDRMEHLVF